MEVKKRNKPKHKTTQLTIRLEARKFRKLKNCAAVRNTSMTKLLSGEFDKLFVQYGLPLDVIG